MPVRMKRAPRPRIPRHKRVDVTRGEFVSLIELLNARATFMDQMRQDLDVQFKRIAHMQAELDALKTAIRKLTTAM